MCILIHMTTAPQIPAKLQPIAAGQTIFINQGGTWTIAGPADIVIDGAIVTVTKRDGSTQQVRAYNVATFSSHGVDFAMANFDRAATTSPAPQASYPAQRVYRNGRRFSVDTCQGCGEQVRYGICEGCGAAQ